MRIRGPSGNVCDSRHRASSSAVRRQAYARANETLSRMTAPLLHISGLCEGDFANGLLLQEERHVGTVPLAAPAL